MPVEKTFHICWVVRVGLRLRASILIVKDASVLSRMIALGVLWRVSSPYSTQCLIFYEKSVVRKYFLSADGWLLHDRMCSLYLTVLFFFFWSQLFVYKVHFCEEFNFSSPVDREGFQMCSLHLFWRRANAWNVSFETLYGGQFTLSTQFIILNYPVTLYHRHNTTVSLETYLPLRVSRAYICQFLRRLKVGVQRENVVS